MSVVDSSSWLPLATNSHAADARQTLYPYLKDLCFTRDGRLLVATLLDPLCSCRERKTLRGYRPVAASIYVFDGDSAATLHCVEYRRSTCAQHCCPVNYKPVMSTCGARLAVIMNGVAGGEGPSSHVVQVYKMPKSTLSLQALCRVAILQRCRGLPASLANLPLPTKLVTYLQFRPEFD